MRQFEFHIHDRRLGAPTLDFVEAEDAAAAVHLATHSLSADPNCTMIEVYDGDEVLLRYRPHRKKPAAR